MRAAAAFFLLLLVSFAALGDQQQKPTVVLFRPPLCDRCAEFERETLAHPTIVRRLPAVAFEMRPAQEGEEASIAFIDGTGVLRARWPFVPATTNFGIILDAVVAVAPDFQRAAELSASGAPHDADVHVARGLARLGFTRDARAALARARANGSTVPFADAAAPAPAPAAPPAALRILPLERQVVSGRHLVRTHVTNGAIAQVVFSLDGRTVARVEKPPFSATLDFGELPERHVVRVTALDRRGREVGRDERVVNEGGETFWLRLVSPREGPALGAVRVEADVRVPAARRVRRVVVSWNDAERAVLTDAPWETTVDIPANQVGVLRAVAELDDGRTSEDAVLLNAGGAAGRADVQLVELPITVITRDGSLPTLTRDRISVREGNRLRRVESVATAAETPLTVGLLFDVSDSMHKTLPDLQEAAIRFLETMLGERDRAFFVSFNDEARLRQPATSDVALLRDTIMRARPDGATALHDAMALGLLQFEGIKGRRAMIVFTDGQDVSSRYTASEVAELARRVNVPVHVIAAEAWSPPRFTSVRGVDEELPRVARATGGTSQVLVDLGQLPALYARIEAALRAQFLAFVRTDPATRENEWRAVRVEVKGVDAEVYAPEGYYATW